VWSGRTSGARRGVGIVVFVFLPHFRVGNRNRYEDCASETKCCDRRREPKDSELWEDGNDGGWHRDVDPARLCLIWAWYLPAPPISLGRAGTILTRHHYGLIMTPKSRETLTDIRLSNFPGSHRG
jgi:hypothetical protein